jgi:hypothetical protein
MIGRAENGARGRTFLLELSCFLAICFVACLHQVKISLTVEGSPSECVGCHPELMASDTASARHVASSSHVQQEYHAVATVSSKSHISAAEAPQSATIRAHTKSIETHSAVAPYAYVFLLAGCDPNVPSYRGFLFNILIATDQLRRELGTVADVVVLVRMAPGTNSTRLSAQEEGWLDAVGARVLYLPSAVGAETFSTVQMLKFHVLRLVQYQRVLYIDSDILPLCNLDYLFDLSVKGVLRENLVIAWTKEPANGGFFMLQPDVAAYQQVQDTISQQHESARHLPAPYFDKINGWGHAMTPDNPWLTFRRRMKGHKWSFYAAHSDQGLLYHYVKFLRRSVSIVLAKAVQNWIPGPNGTVVLEHELHEPFAKFTCRRGRRSRAQYMLHPATGNTLAMTPPFCDFAHFYSVFKPWENLKEAAAGVQLDNKYEAENVLQYWFCLLRLLDERLGMGLPLHGQAWREYSYILRTARPLGGNRVPSLKQLAWHNRSM